MALMLVTGLDAWELEDESTKKTLRGVSIFVLQPVVEGRRGKGYREAKMTGPAGIDTLMRVVPGVYDLDIGVQMKKGVPAATVANAALVSAVDLDIAKVAEKQAAAAGGAK